MNKVLSTLFICLTIISLSAQASLQNASQSTGLSTCEQTISAYGDGLQANDLDQNAIASVARCHTQMLDNLQAARWFEKIADLPECKPEYLLDYGQCLKSLKLYGKAKFYFQKYAQHDPVVGHQFMQSCDIAKMMLEGDQMYDVTPVSANTTSCDYAPGVLAGNLIFNTWEKSDAMTSLYTVNVQGGSVQQFNQGMNGLDGMSHLRFSGDGKAAVYAENGFVSGQRLFTETPGTKVYFTEMNASGKWEAPDALPFGNDAYAVRYPMLSNDGTQIYFASTMPGGKGGWDIYVSTRTNDTWTKPENLGGQVNTPGNEISPFVVGEKLYFSSDWHVGIGGFDVFVASREGAAFGNVRSVGFPVNSPKDDLDFVWNGTLGCGYFSSNRIGGIGFYDLYKAIPQFREIEVSVAHKENMKPLDNAALTMTPGNSMATYTDAKGLTMMTLPLTGEHEVLVKKDGYKDERIKFSSDNNASRKYQVYLEPVTASVSQSNSAQKQKEIMAEPKVTTGSAKQQVTDVKTTTVTSPSKPVHTQEMYFIQIAALARQSSLDPYDDLRNYGDLMPYDAGKYAKVRVGTFATESEAKLILARIRSEGYKDAFVVKQAVESGSTSQSSMHNSEYKVRLGTYAKVGNFNPDLVIHLGALESYRKDDLTIMLLAGFSNLIAAQKARDAAASQGFTDAYVVMDNEGVLERVR